MYNKHLDTFLKVAELGSFSSAAESLFVTPSAVIQQINSLEQELGVSLFQRSRRGVVPTEAGAYLITEAIGYVRQGKEIQRRLTAIASGSRSICVGTSVNYKIRLLYELWTAYSQKQHCDIQLTVLSADGSNAPDTDIVEGIRSRQRWQAHMAFLPIFRVPIAAAVSNHHPLAKKKLLTLSELAPYTFLISEIVLPPNADAFFGLLTDAGIRYECVPDYAPNVMWESSANHQVLLCPLCWTDTLFDVSVIPIAWQQALDYGFFYHNHCSEIVQSLLNFIQQAYSGKEAREGVPVLPGSVPAAQPTDSVPDALETVVPEA